MEKPDKNEDKFLEEQQSWTTYTARCQGYKTTVNNTQQNWVHEFANVTAPLLTAAPTGNHPSVHQ